jgi:hypothetical protein
MTRAIPDECPVWRLLTLWQAIAIKGNMNSADGVDGTIGRDRGCGVQGRPHMAAVGTRRNRIGARWKGKLLYIEGAEALIGRLRGWQAAGRGRRDEHRVTHLGGDILRADFDEPGINNVVRIEADAGTWIELLNGVVINVAGTVALSTLATMIVGSIVRKGLIRKRRSRLSC